MGTHDHEMIEYKKWEDLRGLVLSKWQSHFSEQSKKNNGNDSVVSQTLNIYQICENLKLDRSQPTPIRVLEKKNIWQLPSAPGVKTLFLPFIFPCFLSSTGPSGPAVSACLSGGKIDGRDRQSGQPHREISGNRAISQWGFAAQPKGSHLEFPLRNKTPALSAQGWNQDHSRWLHLLLQGCFVLPAVQNTSNNRGW